MAPIYWEFVLPQLDKGVPASGIPGHLIWRRHSKMCIIYFGTLDNAFSFCIGCSDWHHEVVLLPTKRRVSGPLGFIVPH